MSRLDQFLGAHAERRFNKMNTEAAPINSRLANMEWVDEKIESIHSECEDFVVKNKNMDIVLENGNLFLASDSFQLPFSQWGLAQFCTKIDLPSRYVCKCLVKGEADLAQKNLQTWYNRMDDNKEFLVRAHDNRVRAFLSSKYSTFDSNRIMDSLKGALPEGKFAVQSFGIDQEDFNLRVIDRGGLQIPGEDLFPGFQIRSSEVGNGSIEIDLFLFKLRCTNGLMVGAGSGFYYRRKHVGINGETFITEITKTLQQLPDACKYITDKVEQNRLTTVDPFTFNKWLEDFRKATNSTEELTNKVQDIFKYGMYDRNKWGFVNAITEVAQDYAVDRQVELEQYAGKILLAS